jgi:Raf kinase inhibitor-like YbhB/YbcL family protein
MTINFCLKSPEFVENGTLNKKHEFNSFGGDGNNLSPKLEWSNFPVNAKSFALTLYDPDAPTGSGFWHWIILNIPIDVCVLEKNAGDIESKYAPKNAIHIVNDYGFKGFGGPCPPSGDKPHRYEFVLHAIDVEKIDIDEKCTNAVARFMINQHSIEKAKTTAYYQR